MVILGQNLIIVFVKILSLYGVYIKFKPYDKQSVLCYTNES